MDYWYINSIYKKTLHIFCKCIQSLQLWIFCLSFFIKGVASKKIEIWKHECRAPRDFENLFIQEYAFSLFPIYYFYWFFISVEVSPSWDYFFLYSYLPSLIPNFRMPGCATFMTATLIISEQQQQWWWWQWWRIK